MDIIQDLKQRGLIYQVTDEEGLEKALSSQKIKLYCGFDPTADSLHIGNLLAILTLRRFQLAGHQPYALVGGATGLIGDPSGRTDERGLNPQETVKQWSEKIKAQLSRLLDFETEENPAKVVNNYDWLGSMTIIPFLRDVGKNFSLNYMLAKDSVQSRLEGGISYTEFSYMMLQSYDYYKLYENEGIRLQIGGSDQWGNITAGLEYIRKQGVEEEVFGLTMPLITKSDGTKFGKSQAGAIWLDAEKTSPYEFYQFWYNADDRDVVKLLKCFTFLPLEKIAELETSLKKEPEKRLAQKALAEEMTKIVHGDKAFEQAINISEALFSGDIKSLTADEMKQAFKDVPSYTMESDEPIGLVDLLVNSKISPSKRQAREDINNGAIYLNGDRIQEVNKLISKEEAIEQQFILIRRGKKKYFMIKYKG
ncbi:tyrosine--tRNA ligase [Pueribacillus theae]|uniref:Tyrosine--tRNA ligase n=1 Tax=Pueribacillus theae TaxID=2171751 RepID=A0A2U1JW77_9BACI|nr:tyrosine--tRNA ligase [Pueribacillus theae]PWA09467.1 tyrosine--tRNA ligase [Pueribacillus theae]